jgi:hypothetical protein
MSDGERLDYPRNEAFITYWHCVFTQQNFFEEVSGFCEAAEPGECERYSFLHGYSPRAFESRQRLVIEPDGLLLPA